MQETARSRLKAYGAAVLTVGIFLLLRWPLSPFLRSEHPLMTFFPAVIISAYLGGLGPGLLATFLGLVVASYFVYDPRYPLSMHVVDAYRLGLFLLTGAAISGLTELLHRSRRRIAASERRHAITLASIGDAVIATDTQGRVTLLNPAAEALTGWPLAAALGRPLVEVFRVINEQTREPVEDPAARVLRSGTAVGLGNHTALLTRDGRELPIDDCAAPIVDDRGGVAGVVLVFRNVTQQRQAQEVEVFRRATERWRNLTEALPQLVWSATPDGACDYFSTQWTDHTGVPENDLLGWRWLETLHPEDREPTRQFWLDSVAGRHAYDVEYRVRRRDGEYRWFKTRGVPIRDASGSIVKWFGTCTDFTDLRQTEEALRASEQRFRGTFENAAVGIVHTHPSGRFLRVNEQFCAMLGYDRNELLEKTFQEITYPDDVAASVDALAALVRGDFPGFEFEKRYLRKDGIPVWVDMFVSLQRNAEGQPDYAISVVQDITERKRLDAELLRAKEAAEAANRAKDEFLANVSHEIRTPMNAIIGMTELTLETELSENQRQSLNTVKSAADNLLRIINDLLDFSKIEAGKMELYPADFSLRTAVGDTLRALAVRAHKKGLELIYNVQTDVPDALIGDAGRLRQILLNLVGNAIKFTDAGEVEVRVEITEPRADQEIGLRFTVRDTGIGIPREKQESIFRAFEQEDTSTTRKYGGTGLGLTIASRLVSLMGGRITVQSEPGQGSTFGFTARFGRQAHAAERPAGGLPILIQSLRVLVVDDNATNRSILERWLRSWNLEPQAVGDGVAAVDALWHAAARGKPYELVLLDARMPDADGLALAARIRERAELAATRIVLLTSGDRLGDLARFRELRVNAHLIKPVQQDELLETIYQVMNRGNTGAAPAGKPMTESQQVSVATTTRPLRILAAEDNEFNAQLLEQLLGRRGHCVRVANNGPEALSLAQQGGFDLLFLDLHMPELDGFAVVRAIRERERTAGGHLPVIALTARSRTEDREKCLAAGMDDFLAKPIRATDLWAAIDRAAALHPPVHNGLLDPKVLLAACGDDDATLKSMCEVFRSCLPDHLKSVQDALEKSDARRLREAAHKLAGMIAAFSTTAGNAALQIEDLAAREDLPSVAPMVAQLNNMARDLSQELTDLSTDQLRR